LLLLLLLLLLPLLPSQSYVLTPQAADVKPMCLMNTKCRGKFGPKGLQHNKAGACTAVVLGCVLSLGDIRTGSFRSQLNFYIS
jgi:hypothetical protein